MVQKVRSRDERTPEARAFIKAVIELSREHGFLLYHEDGGGAFIVSRREGHEESIERFEDWLESAYEL